MTRVLTGLVVGVAWLLLLLLAPPVIFWLVICLLALLALQEYAAMLLPGGGRRLRIPFVLLALLPVLAAVGAEPLWIAGGAMAAFAGLLLLSLAAHGRLAASQESVPGSAAAGGHDFLPRAVLGIFYPALLLAHFPLLLAQPAGRSWLLLAAVIAVAADTGAYYAGTRLGRHKLCPSLSPGKTVEGLLGGVLAAMLGSFLVAWWWLPEIELLHSLLFAFILSLTSVAGDLVESLLKRGAGVKDSGTLLPGHGGVLDRIDSLLLVVPLLYYLVLLTEHMAGR